MNDLSELTDMLLPPEKHMRLILNALATSSKTEEELKIVLDWARVAAMTNYILTCALAGEVLLDVQDGDVVFVAGTEEQRQIVKEKYLQLSCCTDEFGNMKDDDFPEVDNEEEV